MSNIIKSFRVIESAIISEEKSEECNDFSNTHNPIHKPFIEEAKEKYDEIIKKAKEEAKAIIDKAYKESEEKLSKAYKKSKEIFKKSEMKGYNKGYELGMEKGLNEGWEKGYNEGKKESEKLIDEALDIKNDYVEKNNILLKELEEDLIELVIAIYEKVLYKKVEEDKDLIVSLVLNGIDNLEISRKLTIIVSKEDYDIIEQAKNIVLAKASLISELDIRINSDMKKGDCIIETSKGSVDVSVENQLSEIRDLLKTILSNER